MEQRKLNKVFTYTTKKYQETNVPASLSNDGILDVVHLGLGDVRGDCQIKQLIGLLTPFIGKKVALQLKTGKKTNRTNGNEFDSTFLEVSEPRQNQQLSNEAGTRFVPKAAAAAQVNRINQRVTEK